MKTKWGQKYLRAANKTCGLVIKLNIPVSFARLLLYLFVRQSHNSSLSSIMSLETTEPENREQHSQLCLEREERSLAQSFDLLSLKFLGCTERWQVRQNCYNTATNHQVASHWTRAGTVTNRNWAQVGGQPIGGLQIFGYSFWLLSQPAGRGEGRADRARLVTLCVLVWRMSSATISLSTTTTSHGTTTLSGGETLDLLLVNQ